LKLWFRIIRSNPKTIKTSDLFGVKKYSHYNNRKILYFQLLLERWYKIYRVIFTSFFPSISTTPLHRYSIFYKIIDLSIGVQLRMNSFSLALIVVPDILPFLYSRRVNSKNDKFYLHNNLIIFVYSCK
jgi:hypothetical protein